MDKQETLEEATKIFLGTRQEFYFRKDSLLYNYLIKISQFGAKWQQERMYSEEDLREAIHESRMQNDKSEDYIFEQLKKNNYEI